MSAWAWLSNISTHYEPPKPYGRDVEASAVEAPPVEPAPAAEPVDRVRRNLAPYWRRRRSL